MTCEAKVHQETLKKEKIFSFLFDQPIINQINLETAQELLFINSWKACNILKLKVRSDNDY